MKHLSMYLGTERRVLHVAEFETQLDLDPEKLESEIKKRAKGEQYLAGAVRISRLSSSDHIARYAYQVTIAHEESLPAFFKIVEEIENDVAGAQEMLRLLDLLTHEEES